MNSNPVHFGPEFEVKTVLIALMAFVSTIPASRGRSPSIIGKVVWIVLFAAAYLFLCHALLTCSARLFRTSFTC
jgi:hypothetical protein